MSPKIRCTTLRAAAKVVAQLNDWTSRPPQGRASFGGWIHGDDGRIKVAQGWRNLGLLLIDTGQVTRDDDAYLVRVKLTDAMRNHLVRGSDAATVDTGAMKRNMERSRQAGAYRHRRIARYANELLSLHGAGRLAYMDLHPLAEIVTGPPVAGLGR